MPDEVVIDVTCIFWAFVTTVVALRNMDAIYNTPEYQTMHDVLQTCENDDRCVMKISEGGEWPHSVFRTHGEFMLFRDAHELFFNAEQAIHRKSDRELLQQCIKLMFQELDIRELGDMLQTL